MHPNIQLQESAINSDKSNGIDGVNFFVYTSKVVHITPW